MKKKNVEPEVKECCEVGKCCKDDCCKDDCCKKSSGHHSDQGNAVYGLGVIGAFVYFFPQMISFSTVVISIIKSIFWPAILVFEALSLLKL